MTVSSSTSTTRTLHPIARYKAVDDALCESYFDETRAGQPVYLDMDDAVLADAGKRLGLAPAEMERELCDAVKALLPLYDVGTGMFNRFNGMLKSWYHEFDEAISDQELPPHPPVVGLMAVFTLAAEQMGDARDAIHVNAYYPRLLKLLDVPESDALRFRDAFMKHSERYWDALAVWLEALDGDRGLPTAYALRQRYIGLPISQALVRHAERKQLLRMFEEMGLPHGTQISAIDMDSTINDWMLTADPPPSANLTGLWSSGAREAIVDAALIEFDNWDGLNRYGRSRRRSATGADETGEIRVVKLMVGEEFDFFENRYMFAAMLPAGLESSLSLVTASERVPVQHHVIFGRFASIPFSAVGLKPEEAFDGVLRVADAGDENIMVRFPRKVVPLAWDTTINTYVEVERLPVGERAALLVSGQDGLSERAAQVLAANARSGFEALEGVRGVPTGWTLFIDVMMLQPPTSVTFGLEALVPRLSVQMALSGGFRIPGRVVRWSTLALPELAVVTEEPQELEVDLQVRRLGSPTESRPIFRGATPILLALGDHIQEDGDYTVVLKRAGTPIQTVSVRARSAAAPDALSWRQIANVGHDEADQLWPLRARPTPESTAVDGAQTFIEGTAHLEAPAPSNDATPTEPRADAATDTGIELAKPEPTSCILTGAHRWQLPRDDGRRQEPFVTGTCQSCGMRKRYPTQHWRARARGHRTKSTVKATPVSQFEALHPQASWDAAVDTLVYLGAGSAHDISLIARQIENSAAFEHHFVRSVESLALIEIVRSNALEMESFEVASTAAAGVDAGTLLTGSWSHIDLSTTTSELEAAGIELSGVPSAELSHIAIVNAHPDEVTNEHAPDAVAVPNAGRTMLLALPHIGSLVPGLRHESPTLLAGRCERFSGDSARWVRADEVTSPGLYRVSSYAARTHFLMTTEGLTYRVSSDAGKYLAAHQDRISLIRYDRRSRELRVPLGCPLPGLYERATVLLSGQLPTPDRKSWTMAYPSVDEEFASQLLARLI